MEICAWAKITLEQAAKWADGGYSVEDVQDYVRAGVDADKAFEWEMAGLDKDTTIEAVQNGMSLHEAKMTLAKT